MAKLLYYKKANTKEGDIIEVKIWDVGKSQYFQDSIKYSLVYIHRNRRILGYDNERGKGHRKHYLGEEQTYLFTTLAKLREDFEKDMKQVRRLLYGNQKS